MKTEAEIKVRIKALEMASMSFKDYMGKASDTKTMFAYMLGAKGCKKKKTALEWVLEDSINS